MSKNLISLETIWISLLKKQIISNEKKERKEKIPITKSWQFFLSFFLNLYCICICYEHLDLREGHKYITEHSKC